MSATFKVLVAALLVSAAAAYYLLAPPRAPLRPGAPAPLVTPMAAKKLEIFERARGRAADPELVALYAEVNGRHFDGGLPAIPVMWDAALADLDALVGGNYHLQGITNGSLMLVSPSLRGDDDELRRTVCHEAVHVKLHPAGAASANHGDRFQAELRRIFEEGCFVAILASDADRESLKRWIDDERARLEREKAAIDSEREQIDAERAAVERAIEEMNARTAEANARRSGWPTADEQAALAARREQAMQSAGTFNERLARHNADADHLNGEIERYRLMVAYPRGVDEDAVSR